MKTANKIFNYNEVYLNKSLDQWAQETHEIMSKKYNWGKTLLKGMFGYDNMISSIGYVFKFCPDKLNINCIAEFIHEGWSINYIYWRDNKPWLKNKFYKKPYNSLGDDRRNNLSKKKFSNIPNEEKQKNIIMAEYIFGQIPKYKKIISVI